MNHSAALVGASMAMALLSSSSFASAAAPSPSASSCGQDRVDALVRGLDEWSRALREKERAAYAERDCARPSVVCLDRLGEATRDTLPPRAVAGEPFAVHVIMPSIDRGSVSISASIRAHMAHIDGAADSAAAPSETSSAEAARCTPSPSQLQSIRAAAAPIASLGSHAGLESLSLPANSWDNDYWVAGRGADAFAEWAAWMAAHRGAVPELTAVSVKIEVPAAEVALDIDFTRTEKGSSGPAAERHYPIDIDNGRYYLELSILVPVVYKGERTAQLTPSVATSELRAGVEEDWHVTGALMVDFFPFGRQRAQLSSFRHCRERTCYANWLGVQFGTGFDKPFEDWYFGLVLEPVSGIALGLGAALRKGEFLGPGLAEGMLLPSRGDWVVNSEYMVRPYLGLAITTDIFQTIDRGAISVRQMR